jgi:hypothetical protein
MKTEKNWRSRISMLIADDEWLSSHEIVSETQRIICDAGRLDDPLVFLEKITDAAGKRVLKEAAGKILLNLEGDGFHVAHATPEISASQTIGNLVSRSFVEALANWQ